MGWMRTWFGSDDPTRRQVITTFVALGSCAAALAGLFVNFIPAPALHGAHIAALFLIIGVIVLAVMLNHANKIGTLSAIMDKGFLKFILICFCAPIFLGFFFWIIFGKSLPWAFTRLFGENHTEKTVLKTHYTRSRRACDHRLRGEFLERSFPSYLCINEKFYRKYPEQVISVTLVGKRSVFGMSIHRVYTERL